MTKFVLFLLLVLGGAYIFPQLYEEVDGPCQALEKQMIRNGVEKGFEDNVVSNFAISLSHGEIGERIAMDKYEKLPARVACLAAYYDLPSEFGG